MLLSHEIATRGRLNFASSTVRDVTVPSVEVSSAAFFFAPTEQTSCMKLDDLNSHSHEHGTIEASSMETPGGSLHGGGCALSLPVLDPPDGRTTNHNQGHKSSSLCTGSSLDIGMIRTLQRLELWRELGADEGCSRRQYDRRA